MKKLILVFAAIAITAGAFAQIDTTHRKMSPREMYNNQNHQMQSNPIDKSIPDGIMMRNGNIMKVEKGEMTALDHDMTLSNGTKILIDGTYTEKDGTIKMLKEGQHIDMEGTLTFLKTDKDRNMYLVPDSTMKKDF